MAECYRLWQRCICRKIRLTREFQIYKVKEKWEMHSGLDDVAWFYKKLFFCTVCVWFLAEGFKRDVCLFYLLFFNLRNKKFFSYLCPPFLLQPGRRVSAHTALYCTASSSHWTLSSASSPELSSGFSCHCPFKNCTKYTQDSCPFWFTKTR